MFAISLLYGRTVLKCSLASFHWSSDLGDFILCSLETLHNRSTNINRCLSLQYHQDLVQDPGQIQT